MRKDIVDAVNRLAMGSGSLDLEVMEMYRLIFDHMMENKKYVSEMKLELVNGVLFIDGRAMERVAPLIRPFNKDISEADYYENKILARAELD